LIESLERRGGKCARRKEKGEKPFRKGKEYAVSFGKEGGGSACDDLSRPAGFFALWWRSSVGKKEIPY